MIKRILIDGGNEVLDRIQRTKITLEELVVENDSSSKQYVSAVIGKIRILNLAFKKSVFARVSFNKWASYRDYSATFTENSEDGSSDVFVFGFLRRDRRPVSVEFCLSCFQDGIEYWDNNDGKNYCFHLAEDPFKELAFPQGAEPEIVVTEKAEESSEPREKETMSETSSYSSFEAHTLTPTKLRFYSSLKNAPEQQVIPTRVKDTKHIRAFNALSIEFTNHDLPPMIVEDEQVEAANAEACEVFITIEETANNATEQNVCAIEEAVEPIKIVKPVNAKAEDEIFDKLEKGQEEIVIALQITEEPCTAVIYDVTDDDGTLQQQSESIASTESTQHQNKNKKSKKKKIKAKDEKHENSSDKKHKATDPSNEDRSSLSSTKERIEKEGPTKTRKKGFLSKLACCGKAEPN